MALPLERRSQLLAYLALRRGSVARTELAALLWPEAPVEQAHTNLRKTLFRLRESSWAAAIVAHEQSLAFNGSTDVADFEAAIAQRRWADALDIGGDPLLTGFDDDASEPWSAWLGTERERLHNAWCHAAERCLAAADPADALALSTRLLTLDPLNDFALRAQMLAYAQLGRPARARDAYRRFAAQLAEATGRAPPAELQAVRDALGISVDAAPPAVDGAVAPPRIIGRIIEQRTIRERLKAGHRLLSLVGPGGIGKSSLAQHLCLELAPHYADGTVYVPLDDVESPDALGARLARELAVTSGIADPLQATITSLRGRCMLLVLDNFEHLQAAAPQLQQMLDACPRAQLLVTSRMRLSLPSEHLLPLDGLPCPSPEDSDCLEAFDAARLFVHAAQAVAPTLNPAAEAAAIADICRLVDGLPLALKIAAAWTRVLSCHEIAAELRRDIGLLTQSDAARPARHASMAAVFEQSWQRLRPAERSTWARLTVFHGGFTLDAARAVVGATLPVLAALTDQSLLRKAGSRFDLHPLLRQLAAERLADDERTASSKAHAAYYLRWLVPLRSAVDAGDKETLQQIDIELENVRAAWHWTALHGPADWLHAAAVPLLTFCDMRGRIVEGIALHSQAACGVGAVDERLRPLLDASIAHFTYRQGLFSKAHALADRALLAARVTRDYDTRLLCFKVLANCAIELGRVPLARRRYRQGLADASAANDSHNASTMIGNLAMVEALLGRSDTARTLFMRALAEHRRLRNAYLEAICLNNLATLELGEGHLDTAATHLETCIALCERAALTRVRTSALITSTELAVQRNDAIAAQRYGHAACENVRQMGARDLHAWLQLRLMQAAVQQGDLDAARTALRVAAEDAIELQAAPLQLDCVVCLAQLLHAQREAGAATRLLQHVIDHPATEVGVRNRASACYAAWSSSPPAASAALPPAAADLHMLLHRMAAETPTAHAALIAALSTQ